jgi:hypothetical protein
MAYASTILIDDALREGQQQWTLALDNWGNIETGADVPASYRYNVDRPVVGAAIHPDSDVAECFIRTYHTQDFGRADDTLMYDQQVYVRRGAPVFWRMAAPLQVVPTPQSQWGDDFTSKDGVFGQLWGNPFGANFIAPTLKLNLFFEHAPQIAAESSWEREIRYISAGAGIALGNLNRVNIGWCPIQHRKNARVLAYYATNESPVEIEVTGMRGWGTLIPGGVDTSNCREFQLYSTPFIMPAETDELEIPVKNPHANWLGLYARRQIWDGQNRNISWRVYAD